MRMSHSRVDTFIKCPYKFKLMYLDGLKATFNLDPTNALVLGTAMHEGIEKNVEDAIRSYYSNYPTVTVAMVNEAIKLEIMVSKAKEVLKDQLARGTFEEEIDDDDFIGYIDLMVPVEGEYNTVDIYDFKYSNNVKSYLKSRQLHLYKYFLERLDPTMKVRNMAFVFIPKVNLKQEDNEDIREYRRRLIKECEEQKINVVPIEYDPNKVIDYLLDVKKCIECEEFDKNPNFCYWCDFNQYCKSDGKLDGRIIYPKEGE